MITSKAIYYLYDIIMLKDLWPGFGIAYTLQFSIYLYVHYMRVCYNHCLLSGPHINTRIINNWSFSVLSVTQQWTDLITNATIQSTEMIHLTPYHIPVHMYFVVESYISFIIDEQSFSIVDFGCK